MRQCRKTKSAVFLGDDQREKAVFPDELPDMGRQVMAFMGDVPFIEHGA